MSPTTLPLYPSSRIADKRNNVVILDGGLGTTLEQTFNLDISHTALWSAKAAIEHPETIVDAHLAFLRAGARIILTSTYQCSLSTFEKAGYAGSDAREIMAKCVQLAAQAKARFSDEGAVPDPGVKIALSLGPFGAGLTPAQEFDGYYPPPFGPRAYTPEGGNRNAFGRDAEGRKSEEEATTALARWHLERLCVFADDAAAWAAVDFFAFETVPLVREVWAIRMAMKALEERGGGARSKPWWISCVFPGGQFPETAGESDGGKVPVRSVVAAALDLTAASAHLPTPSALGINCTEMDEFPHILADMESAVQEFRAHEHSAPWLVLYPNIGDVYDPVSQTWVVKEKGRVWAEQLGELAAKIQSESAVWAGVVAGGCCRTGPEDIGLLSKVLGGSIAS
ncbi:Homocysteine S-methyltransferase [Mycena epipterygia]|nr:Homocysteine S-methyltransferase [Mycena epipterygia]